MKNKIIILISFFFVAIAALCYAGNYIKTVAAQNVVGVITLSVENVQGNGWWLGCSTRKGSKVTDLAPRSLTRDGQYQFTNLRNYDEFNLKIWGKKVSSTQCKKTNGKACSYCKKNGFHMADEIESTDWMNGTSASGF